MLLRTIAFFLLPFIWACSVTIPPTHLTGTYHFEPGPDGGPGRYTLTVEEAAPLGSPDAALPPPDAGLPDTGPVDSGTPPGPSAGLYEPPCCAGSGYTPPGEIVPEEPMQAPTTETAALMAPFGTRVRALPAGFRHVYSQLQAWDVSGEYMLLMNASGSVRVWSSSSKAFLELQIPGVGHKWRSGHSEVVTWLGYPGRAVVTSVPGGQRREIPLAPYQAIKTGPGWESTDRAGRFTAAYIENDGQGQARALVVDLERGAVTLDRTLQNLCGGTAYLDWLAPSPSGRYLAMQFAADGPGRCQGFNLFDIQTGHHVRHVHDHHHHSDMGIDLKGEDFMVSYENYHPANNNYPSLVRYDFETGKRHDLRMIPWGRLGHVSCQGPAGAPCLVTASYILPEHPILRGEIYLLHDDGSILRLAHHRSTGCGSYNAQPQGSMAPDGRTAVFASDWGRGCSRVDGFLLTW